MIGNVVGNYRIEREIGEGGMSHVYVGRTLAATEYLPQGYPVVLKAMSEELAGEATARKAFVHGTRMRSDDPPPHHLPLFGFLYGSRDSNPGVAGRRRRPVGGLKPE